MVFKKLVLRQNFTERFDSHLRARRQLVSLFLEAYRVGKRLFSLATLYNSLYNEVFNYHPEFSFLSFLSFKLPLLESRFNRKLFFLSTPSSRQTLQIEF